MSFSFVRLHAKKLLFSSLAYSFPSTNFCTMVMIDCPFFILALSTWLPIIAHLDASSIWLLIKSKRAWYPFYIENYLYTVVYQIGIYKCLYFLGIFHRMLLYYLLPPPISNPLFISYCLLPMLQVNS